MTKIILRHDTSTNWTNINPVLSQGELGIETDTSKFKIGDGDKTWSELPYSESELDKYLSATSTDSTVTLSANNKSLKIDAPTIEVGENLVDEIGVNANLYLKQDTVEAGPNVTVDKTATGIRINSVGGGEVTNYDFQTPLAVTDETSSILLSADEYTSNTVAGKYEITSTQSYSSGTAYERFKQEVWDGNSYRSAIYGSILTYTRTDGANFPAGTLVMDIPFVTYNCCIGSIEIKTWDSSGSELQTFTKTFDAVPLSTGTKYTMELDVTEPFAKFTIQLNPSSASGFNTGNQNRIGPITFGKVTGGETVGLSIDNATLKINGQGQLYAEQQSAPTNMVTTDTTQNIRGVKTFNDAVYLAGNSFVAPEANGYTWSPIVSGGAPYFIKKLTQAEYDALTTKNANTIYVIIG